MTVGVLLLATIEGILAEGFNCVSMVLTARDRLANQDCPGIYPVLRAYERKREGGEERERVCVCVP